MDGLGNNAVGEALQRGVQLCPLAALFLLAATAAPAAIHEAPGTLVRTDRYTLLKTHGGRTTEPLAAMVNVRFAREVNTIGAALQELLRESGYRISLASPHNRALVERVLYPQPLPAILRRLGPMSLLEALQVVAGSAWKIRVGELGRTVAFEVGDSYRRQGRSNDLLRSRPRRFFVPFARGEVYAPREADAVPHVVAQLRQEAWRPYKIVVRGHSSTRGDPAGEARARQRAQRVLQLLRSHGADPSLLHQEARPAGEDHPQPLEAGVEVLVWDNFAPLVHAAAATASATSAASQGRDGAVDVFTLQPGSLRANLRRLLEGAGWSLHWRVRQDGKLLDWKIPKQYSLAFRTPEEAVQQLLEPYARFLGADFHTPDRTVVVLSAAQRNRVPTP